MTEPVQFLRYMWSGAIGTGPFGAVLSPSGCSVYWRVEGQVEGGLPGVTITHNIIPPPACPRTSNPMKSNPRRSGPVKEQPEEKRTRGGADRRRSNPRRSGPEEGRTGGADPRRSGPEERTRGGADRRSGPEERSATTLPGWVPGFSFTL
ncbi:hypothetical protein DPEC_G00296660 [Dallia pectoralis]|uniref:Uncharacterized protein n=1 Tax=Dallia pectoralis TaxID=75939 RepID=A0ACC2FFE6_DALPE|nr:hypothetical protein DPEC_G00296660 [Dallia pectoralis]